MTQKKIIFIGAGAVLLAVLLVFIIWSFVRDRDESFTDWIPHPLVTARLEGLTPYETRLIIENNSDHQLWYGFQFTLFRWTRSWGSDFWQIVPFPDDIEFPTMGLPLAPHSVAYRYIGFDFVYGGLESGLYKIRKGVSMLGGNGENPRTYLIEVEFEIHG